MTKFWTFVGLLMAFMLLLFFVLQAFDIAILKDDPAYWLSQEKWLAALAGVGLLVADVIAPVPSSVIMFANGALFGPVLGALLSLIGGLGAAILGHWLGGRGERVARRWMGEEALRTANRFFRKYGLVAVILTRPIPIMAEAVSITAGLSGMSRQRLFWGSVLGLLPAAILFALVGTYAVEWDAGTYALLAVVAIAGLGWLVGRQYFQEEADSPVSN